MKTIFVISRDFRVTVGGDSKRVYNVYQTLLEFGDVEIWCVKPIFGSKSILAYPEIDVRVFEQSIFDFFIGLFIAVFTHHPISSGLFFSNKLKSELKNVQAARVFFHLCRTSMYWVHNSKVDNYLDMGDLISVNYSRASKHLRKNGNIFKSLIYYFESKKYEFVENLAREKFQLIFIHSKHDFRDVATVPYPFKISYSCREKYDWYKKM